MTALFTAPSVDEIIAKLGAQSTCDAGLTQDPWHFDTTTPSYGPGASMLDRLPANAPAGSAIAVGTELNLVNRLAAQYPDKTVFCLDPVVCPCSTMYRIHPAYLAWALENLEAGNVVNRITVDEDTAREAKVALERMLRVHP